MIGRNGLKPITTLPPHAINHTSLWPPSLTANWPRDDRLQRAPAYHPATIPCYAAGFTAYHNRERWRSGRILGMACPAGPGAVPLSMLLVLQTLHQRKLNRSTQDWRSWVPPEAGQPGACAIRVYQCHVVRFSPTIRSRYAYVLIA